MTMSKKANSVSSQHFNLNDFDLPYFFQIQGKKEIRSD